MCFLFKYQIHCKPCLTKYICRLPVKLRVHQRRSCRLQLLGEGSNRYHNCKSRGVHKEGERASSGGQETENKVYQRLQQVQKSGGCSCSLDLHVYVWRGEHKRKLCRKGFSEGSATFRLIMSKTFKSTMAMVYYAIHQDISCKRL